MDKVLEFLTDLAANNNRDWFHDNKERYNENREKMLFITDVLINEIRKFDREVPLLEPKDCLFRIYRDVRFSKNKQPYKTHFGGFISKGGRKGIYAGYYFHVEPLGSFSGGGIYMPAAAELRAVRNRIAEYGAEFLEIMNDPDFKKIYPELMDDKLKTAPKGFPKDHEFIDLLRYKSFAFSTPISTSEILNGDYISLNVSAFQKLSPINAFINEALEKK